MPHKSFELLNQDKTIELQQKGLTEEEIQEYKKYYKKKISYC